MSSASILRFTVHSPLSLFLSQSTLALAERRYLRPTQRWLQARPAVTARGDNVSGFCVIDRQVSVNYSSFSSSAVFRMEMRKDAASFSARPCRVELLSAVTRVLRRSLPKFIVFACGSHLSFAASCEKFRKQKY